MFRRFENRVVLTNSPSVEDLCAKMLVSGIPFSEIAAPQFGFVEFAYGRGGNCEGGAWANWKMAKWSPVGPPFDDAIEKNSRGRPRDGRSLSLYGRNRAVEACAQRSLHGANILPTDSAPIEKNEGARSDSALALETYNSVRKR